MFAVIDQTGIDLIGHQPQAPLAAEFQQRFLVFTRHDPAGRVAWRIDKDRTGLFVNGIEHGFQIKLPAKTIKCEGCSAKLAPKHVDGALYIRPGRCSTDNIGAGFDQQLVAEHDAAHARGRDCDSVIGHRYLVERARVAGKRMAQVRHASVGRVEGLSPG